MSLWEIKAIIRGYNARMMLPHRTAWETARWQTCCILKALGVRNINEPSDLARFSWEKSRDEEPTDEQVEEMRQRLQEENRIKETSC